MKVSRIRILHFFLFAYCCHCDTAYSQKKFSLNIGGGVGSFVGGGGDSQKTGRLKFQLNGYYNLNNRQSLGLEIAGAGSFANSLGGNIEEYDFDPASNTRTLGPTLMNSTTFLAKYKYFLLEENNFRPFLELGVGLNTYTRKIFNVPALLSEKIKRHNFSVQPEIGFTLSRFQLSIAYLFGGSTPAFTGVLDSGENLKLESRRFSTLYLNASYCFGF